MVKLVIVKNPFQPRADRTIKHIPYGFTVRQMVEMTEFKGVEINCIINGDVVTLADDYVIPDNQMVVLSPVVGKGRGAKILGMVVGIALMVVGGLAVAGKMALFAAAGSSVAIGAGIAVGLAGSFLISYSQSAYAKSIGSTNYETSTNDATYSWSGVQTMEGQNNPVALTYGKVKSGGQTIGKYITTSGDNQYLNWLVSAGEGELSFSDIMINDNPVSYYSGISLETRSGTNNQSVIPYFNDTYASKSFGYQLLDGYRTETCQGNAVQGFKFEIEFSNGLYYANDSGGLNNAWVDIYAEYRRNGGAWTPVWYAWRTDYYVNGGPGGISVNGSAPTGNYTITYSFDDEDYSYFVRIYYPNGRQEKRWVYVGEPRDVGDFRINVDGIPRRYNYDSQREEYIPWTYTFSVTSNTYSYATSTRIEGAQSSALRREYRVDNLTAGEYDVRLHVTGRSHAVNNSRASVRCFWNTLTSIVYDDFSYPNTALIGIQALATDQISGTPKLTFIKERSYVWVYVPNVGYQQRPANNPAWACYDMLHLASRIQNVNTGAYVFDVRGVPANHIMYEQFNEWANFCSAKQLYVNIEITQCGEMLETINGQIALIGRGNVLRFGTRYGCVWDCVKQPVQMFGMGNIISGTMQEEFLQTSERANCVEITFNNADHDYERETITIYSENYDSDAEEKTSQVTYNGITSYNQAYREGKYQLYCNKFLLRTVSFEANIDAIACTIGDVILVAHDVPQWAYSGRIYSVDLDNNELTLPIEMLSTDGQYRIMYRTVNDTLHTSNITILENADGYCKVKCNRVFDLNDLPQVNDIFDIALSNIGSKPFVVKSITRANDFTRKLECIEYNENVYNENYSIPAVNYSLDSYNKAKNVTRLNASQVTYVDDTIVKKSMLFVSWVVPDNGGSFTVMYSTNKQQWKVLASGLIGDNYSTDVEYGKDCYIKVVTTLGVSKSNGVITDIVRVGADIVPPNVTHLDTELLSNGTRRFWWEFTYPKPNDIAGFVLKYVAGDKPDWTLGNKIQDGLVTQQPYEAHTVMQGQHCIMIKAIDNAGNESEKFASCVVDFGDPIKENILWESDFLKNVDVPFWKKSSEAHFAKQDNQYWAKYNTNGELTKQGYIRSKQSNSFWYNSSVTHFNTENSLYWSEMYNDFYFETIFMCPVSGNFFLLYDVEGYYDLKYYIEDKDDIYKQYSTKISVKAGDIIHVMFETKSGSTRTILKKLVGVIDVPDRQEHFENITIDKNGTELPIMTPNFYTVSIVIDSISVDNLDGRFELVRVSENPCVVKFVQIVNDAQATRKPITVVADITWQGFEKEVINK